MGEHCIINEKTINDLILFYTPYFYSKEGVEELVRKLVFAKTGKVGEDKNITLCMLNQVKRYIGIIEHINEDFPGRDGLVALFIRICMESLCKLSDTKMNVFCGKFCKCFCQEAEKYILDRFVLESLTVEGKELTECSGYKMSLEDFFYVMKHIRDQVAHEGVFWNFLFFSPDGSPLQSYFESDETLILRGVKNCNDLIIQYNFETALLYEKFLLYFVDACVRYIVEFAKIY
jgi:hypothetical protein